MRARDMEQGSVVWAEKVEGKCNAKLTKQIKNGRGPRCKAPAGRGTTHLKIGCCELHGGNTGTHERAASKVLAVREVRRLGLARGDAPRQVGPAEVLLNALWAANEDLELYREMVTDLDAATGPNGPSGTNGTMSARLYAETYHLTGEATGEAKRHILVQLYEDAQKRAADIATACLRAKVAEEQVKLAQERAAAFAGAMRALALALGHSPADPKVRQAMRQALADVAMDDPPPPPRSTDA